MKRVSKQVQSKKLSYHQKFADNYHVNQMITNGDWLDLCFVPDMLSSHLFECIMDTYDLDEEIGKKLVLSYSTYPTRRTNTKNWLELIIQTSVRSSTDQYVPLLGANLDLSPCLTSPFMFEGIGGILSKKMSTAILRLC